MHHNLPFIVSGVLKAVWVEIANAAATTWLQTTWIRPAVKTTARTSAATTENACVAHASARRDPTQRKGTAASSASVTTSTVIALKTNCVEVSVSMLQIISVASFKCLGHLQY